MARKQANSIAEGFCPCRDHPLGDGRVGPEAGKLDRGRILPLPGARPDAAARGTGSPSRRGSRPERRHLGDDGDGRETFRPFGTGAPPSDPAEGAGLDEDRYVSARVKSHIPDSLARQAGRQDQAAGLDFDEDSACAVFVDHLGYGAAQGISG